MQSPLAAASPIGLLVPLWGGVAPAMGQSRGYRVALSLLWGRTVAMGSSCRCYGAEPWLWGGAVTAMGQSHGYGVALYLQ